MAKMPMEYAETNIKFVFVTVNSQNLTANTESRIDFTTPIDNALTNNPGWELAILLFNGVYRSGTDMSSARSSQSRPKMLDVIVNNTGTYSVYGIAVLTRP